MKPLVTLLDDYEVRGGRLWMYLFVGHAIAAFGWWCLMPGGFPWFHSRFWLNQVFPLITSVISMIGCYGIWSKRESIVRVVIFALLGFWTGAVAMAWIAFPISIRRFGIPVGTILLTVWLAWWVRSPTDRLTRRVILSFVLSLLSGTAVCWQQRAHDPSVTPLNVPIPALAKEHAVSEDSQRPTLPPTLRTSPIMGKIQVSMGSLRINVSPLLTFESCSPDRCWTIFAPAAFHLMPMPVLRDEQHLENREIYRYEGDVEHQLQIVADAAGTGCEIESFSRIQQPIFSHLNYYTDISITGHRQLSIAFSPCPDVRIEVKPADYPEGRPARFAYLDATHLFHVVEASSGEKGPFRDLASGPLSPTDSLTMMLYDNDHLTGTIEWEDWASQLSTALSPTAGWGVPQNTIEFRRALEDSVSEVSIWLTLANTSVGRGWDSVGHRAGTYRNRIRIKKEVE